MGGHILKAELADVKGKEREGLIMSISFLSKKKKTVRSLWDYEVRQIEAEKDLFS